MADADVPDLQEDYDISVKVPKDRDGETVQQYLTALANKINESDGVSITEVETDGSDRGDASGGWKDATLSIYVPTLGCGTKKSDPDYVDDLT